MAEKQKVTKPDTGRLIYAENVEIERKFTVSEDCEDRIIQAGGTCIGNVTFTDSYFDTDSQSVTRADHWLRRRNGKWELKVPLSERGKENSTGTCTKYSEITDENEIIAHLSTILLTGTCGSSNISKIQESEQREELLASELDTGLEKWLSQQSLECFAEFTTHRKSYSVDGGILIVLDETDFGFGVGEIEIMTRQSEEDIAAAVAKINQMAEKLGIGTQAVVQGKMNTFLRRFAPRHYEVLLAAGVLER